LPRCKTGLLFILLQKATREKNFCGAFTHKITVQLLYNAGVKFQVKFTVNATF